MQAQPTPAEAREHLISRLHPPLAEALRAALTLAKAHADDRLARVVVMRIDDYLDGVQR